ncbi:hypothetical protein B0T44_11495 [Nocardia donostiensis]|uniref:Uncharacterized protein n=1 Tax=Nocardia donostiensis TaxID=1538463 RepID=A0A1W0AY82_9NOCA|nr:hypothetical protein B0T46_19505 [Nocardia donostiensis]OQS15172.1 hypothetical protein B0T36_10995 [Nocardia donostiensis]OQS20142.1 hypothetical protein B0T44_11495 [Nocardia donostiensis]
MDEVPEADLAEQSVPAYPDDPAYSDIDSGAFPEDTAATDVEPGPSLRDNWNANTADIVEQSISVPLEDEYGDLEDEYPGQE